MCLDCLNTLKSSPFSIPKENCFFAVHWTLYWCIDVSNAYKSLLISHVLTTEKESPGVPKLFLCLHRNSLKWRKQYCDVLGYLTTSEHQMWRVMPLKMPFVLVIRFIKISYVVTTINYNYLLRCYTFTQLNNLTRQYSILDIFTYSHFEILLANCMPPHSLRNWNVKAEQSRAVAYCRQPASKVTPGIEPRWDPWPYICSVSRLLFFSSFVVPSLIKREGFGFSFFL
jgi:hypothetical protein